MALTDDAHKTRKKRTREQLFKKQKSKEAAQRAASIAAAGRTAATKKNSSASAKGKGKAKATGKGKGKGGANDQKDGPSFHYVSFNDRLAAVHIDVARSQRSSAIAGLDPLPGLNAGASSSSGSGSSYRVPGASLFDDGNAPTALALFSGEDAELATVDLSELASTAFGTALVTWRELNQSLPFYAFVRRILPLSNSLPQLIHHAETIADTLCALLGSTQPQRAQGTTVPKPEQHGSAYLAFAPALDLIPRLAHDLQTEFLPFYPRCLEALLRTTQVNKLDTDGVDFLAADIVEAAFKATAGLLRIVAPLVLADTGNRSSEKAQQQQPQKDQLGETWITLRPYLGWVEPKTTRSAQKAFDDWDGMDVDDDESGEEEEQVAAADEEEHADGSDSEDEDEGAEDEDEDEDGAAADDEPPEPTNRIQQYRRRRVPPHTRRFASEAFAHLVRKARGARLGAVAHVMLADVASMRIHAARGAVSAEDAKGFESAVAGVWAEVIKSVDDHLHSAATQYLDAALLVRAESRDKGSAPSEWIHAFCEARKSMGILLLTALNHHSSAAQMVGVIQHVLGWVETRLSQTGPGSQRAGALQEAVAWLTTVVGVRKGSRVHESLKNPLFALLVRLATLLSTLSTASDGKTEERQLSCSILSLITLSFPTGRIQDLIGPGLKVIDALIPAITPADGDAYARTSYAFYALVLSLADPTLAWSGFRQFVMPAVLKHTAEVAAAVAAKAHNKQGPLQMSLALLARLEELGELGAAVSPAAPTPAIGKWRVQIGDVLRRSLSSWTTGSAASAAILEDTSAGRVESVRADLLAHLTLLPTFAKEMGSEIVVGLSALLKDVLASGCPDAEATLQSYRESALNVAFVLASTLDALAKILRASNAEKVARPVITLLFNDSSSFVCDVVERVGFHTGAVRALADLLAATTTWSDPIFAHFEQLTALPVIADLLSSIENSTRVAACELLAQLARLSGNKDAAGPYERLLEIERTELSIESIRERNVRVRAAARSIAQAVKLLPKGTQPSAHLQRAQTLTVTYIVGSLKLNFRPVWSESIAALVDLAAVGGDEVWDVAFAQLDVVHDPVQAALKSAPWCAARSKRLSTDDDEADATADTLERMFKDPVLQTRLRALQAVYGAAADASASVKSLFPKDAEREQRPSGRLDAINYHDQILKLFGEVPRLAEKHNAPLVQRFFAIVRFDVDEEQRDEKDEEEQAEAEQQQPDMPHRGFLERRAQLCSFLELFGKFGNPKALLRTEDLHSYFLELCASGDLKIQQLALTCVLTWKNPAQTPYADSLKNLLDPSAFRDELMQFNLAPESNIVQAHHRPVLMPLLVRLLYGQIISRRGKATTGAGKHSRKHAILSALSSCQPADLDVFIKLMLRPFEELLPVFDAESGQFQFAPSPSSASRKRQVGYLSLLADVLKHLGQLVLAHWPSLMGVTLNLGHHAARSTDDAESGERFAKGGRAVRRAVYQRLADFSRRALEFDWLPFLIPMFDSLINAQAQLLRVEAMQAPTALLELLHTWSSRTDTMMFLSSVNEDIPRHLLACLAAPAASGAVLSRVLDIFERIIATTMDQELSEEERQAKRDSLITPYLGDILANGGALLSRLQKPKTSTSAYIQGREDILKRSVSMLATLAPYVERPSDAELLLKLLIPMLQQQRTLDERIKKDLLSIFSDLCLKAPSFHDTDSDFFNELMEILSSMFAALRTRPARLALVSAFRNFGVVEPALKQAANWAEELNSYSTKRLEEPDFDRRLDAFFQISESDASTASAQTWTPLLHNMVFFVQDAEELAIRTNAAATLRQFFGLAAARMDDDAWQKLLLRVALPAVRRIMRSKADLVRREALSLLADAIETLPDVPALSQMKGLLSDGDGEASFFNNIVHLQVHRRVRALRRLGDEAEKGVMSGKLVKDTFIPLVGLFLDPAQTSDQQLINEAINTTGRLAGALTWYGYQALVWSLIKKAREHPPNEKVVVRTLMTVLDNFKFDLKAVVAEEKAVAGEADIVVDEDEAEPDAEAEAEAAEAQAQLAQNAKISEAVTGRLLPALMGFLESRDDTDDAIRLPVAVGIARLALKLPTKEANMRIYKLLNTLTGALKSKSQETRDLTREVFLKIARILGPAWLLPISVELKKGLTRGPQVAVAAFTFHAVLVYMAESAEAPLTIVDGEMPTIMSIVSEDLFGLTSEDRDNAEYKSKHREVRQGKSLDTLERLAKLSAPHRIAAILLPLREVMERTEAQKPMRVVDDALRRIASGLISNPHIEPHTFLILCHSLISGNSRFLQSKTKTAAKAKGKAAAAVTAEGIDNVDVLSKRKAIESQRADANHYSRNAFRFVAFGLDLLLTALKRGRFSFNGADDQQQQLLPLVKSVGNALYSSQASIVQLALRATAELVKSPLQRVTDSLPAFIKQIFAIIQAAGSAQSETVQTAFKTLTTIIRERKDSVFQEKQLADLLRLMMPDLEEPGVQWVIFGLLRAIIGRRFVVAEVYDVMTKIAEMMVTNQSASTRENCRAIMLQFLLDYPQGKGRLKHQMAFFAKNLSYTYESGRLSVMELLRVIFAKFDEGALQPFHELLLVALVMVMANDDSEICRTNAGELIRTIVRQQNAEARTKTITMVHSWAQQPNRPQLSCVALQLYCILLEDIADPNDPWLAKAMEIALSIVQDCADDFGALQAEGAMQGVVLDYKLPLAGLQAVARLFKANTGLLQLKDASTTWPAVETLLLFSQESVRLTSGRLLGAMFAGVEADLPSDESGPLAPAHLVEVGKKLAKQLSFHPLSEDLSLQAVKNLLFVGRHLASSTPSPASAPASQDADRDDDVDEEEANEDEDEDADLEHGAEEEEDDEDAEQVSDQKALANPLAWLFSKLSFQARHAVFSAEQRYEDNRWHAQPSAILKWFAAMVTHTDVEVAKAFLPHMLTPIFYITDDSTIRSDQIEELKGLATEVQTLIQQKVGATTFAQVYSGIRQRALAKRRERKTAKLMTTISRPEAAAQRKSKVNARKHDSRKRKAQHQADSKIRNKPLKRHRTAA
ncbi:U3 snoRNP protein [Tilletia horrida]|uniref:U3 snoRNP protein n=1 Tax=Tilletia horrida TaxID=155126 RepID=A0AAN6GAI1_9BASI|nr:U3 snoRNP protein [Tilletia horrida]